MLLKRFLIRFLILTKVQIPIGNLASLSVLDAVVIGIVACVVFALFSALWKRLISQIKSISKLSVFLIVFPSSVLITVIVFFLSTLQETLGILRLIVGVLVLQLVFGLVIAGLLSWRIEVKRKKEIATTHESEQLKRKDEKIEMLISRVAELETIFANNKTGLDRHIILAESFMEHQMRSDEANVEE